MRLSLHCGCSRDRPIFKAAAPGPMIDRDRPAIRKLRLKLKTKTKAFLKKQAPIVARQVLAARTALTKAAKDDVEKILAELDFDGWSTLAGDVDSVIEQILVDAGAQAMAQIGVSDEKITELVNERAVEYAKERAAELVTKISESTRGMLRADVAEAMQDGWSNDELAAAIEDNYGFSPDRADMIARTETAYADVSGNLEAYRASGVVTGKKWITGADCCDLCDALDGTVVDLDETFETEDGGIDGPPYHPNCFVLGTEVAAFGVTSQFSRRFTGEIAVIGIAGMDDISVTPNHPILTRRGWVAAGQLQVGDEVVQCLNPGIAFAGLRQPNDNYVQAPIEQVAGALRVAGRVSAGLVPVATIDFHGDGIADTEVHVVRSKRLLAHDVAVLQDFAPDGSLGVRHGADESLGRGGAPAQFIESSSPAFGGSVRAGDELAPVGVAGLAHAQQHAAAAITHSQPHAFPAVAQGGAVATDSPGYIHTGLAGHVAFVKVENLRFAEYDGHVFNLETGVGWYVAGGIVTHNCRCDIVPVLEGEGEN